MSQRALFELPRPVELGDGWSLGFLTAARTLESREEGEALAGEDRDKALWANAALLSRVLLRKGQPAFESGRAVLEALTVGQIAGLARLWWQQDSDFFVPAQPRPFRELPGMTEGGENEHFDMARFLELGGKAAEDGVQSLWPVRLSREGGRQIKGPAEGESFSIGGAAALWEMPLPVIPGPRKGQRPPLGGEASPPRGGSRQLAELADEGSFGSEGTSASWEDPLLRPGPAGLPRPGESQEPSKTAPGAPALPLEELDRAVERDARRYDGGFSLL